MAKMPPAVRVAVVIVRMERLRASHLDHHQSGPPEFGINAPPTNHRGKTDQEGQERERYEADTKADVRAGAEPVHNPPSGLGGLVRCWLDVAHEKGCHEQRSRKNQQQLDDR